jgi:hypothetical protein
MALNEQYLKQLSECKEIKNGNVTDRFKYTIDYAAELIGNFLNPASEFKQEIQAPIDCDESIENLFPITLVSKAVLDLFYFCC